MPKRKEDLEVTAGTAATETTENGAEVADVEDTTAELRTETPEPATAGPPKPKRTRKKKADAVDGEEVSRPKKTTAKASGAKKKETEAEVRQDKSKTDPILTLEVDGEVTTETHEMDAAWHEILTSHRSRRILTGMLGGVEETELGKTLAIVDYKGFRVVIPLKEMLVKLEKNLKGAEYTDMIRRQNKLLSNMLGCEIDFIVKGVDPKTRTVVASRKEAMLKKRQVFYMNQDASGNYRIYDGRTVQARVIAVAEKAVRIEAFGVECSIMARDLSWDWIGDANERFSVGDEILAEFLRSIVIMLKISPYAQMSRVYPKTPTAPISSNAASRANMPARLQMCIRVWCMSVSTTVPTQSPTPALTDALPAKRMMYLLPLLTLMKTVVWQWVSSPVSSSSICELLKISRYKSYYIDKTEISKQRRLLYAQNLIRLGYDSIARSHSLR